MNRSITKNTFRMLLALALTILIGQGMAINAQSSSTNESRSISFSTQPDGKVKIKIVTKKGDDQQIFEKTFDSYEDMKDDPELKEHGIDSEDFNFGTGSFGFNSGGSNIFFRRGFGPDNDEDDHSIFFNFGLDSLRDHFKNFGNGSFGFHFGDDDFSIDIDSMMQRFKTPGWSGFKFGFDDDEFGIDIDSLRNHFKFGTGGDGSFWLNGEEFEDMESLREAFREKFGHLDFDMDFGDWDDHDGSWHFKFGDEGDDDGFRVISRVKVFVRAAREADKEKVGADKMEELEIKDISFYPNPSDGRFTVDISTSDTTSPIQVKVINGEGAVVYDRNDRADSGESSFRVDLSDERRGIYILQVIQNNKALTKRVIIE